MITGRPPFKGESEYLTFTRINEHDLDFPPTFPAAAKDLVERLLNPVADQRIGEGECFISGCKVKDCQGCGGSVSLVAVQIKNELN
jgi:serine/threonine protein kinase